MKYKLSHEFGIIDHIFIGGGLEWNVFVRVVPNQSGSTTSWIFMRPNGLNDDQFEDQLKMFDVEINQWKIVLENFKDMSCSLAISIWQLAKSHSK